MKLFQTLKPAFSLFLPTFGIIFLLTATSAFAASSKLSSAIALISKGEYTKALPLLKAEAEKAPDDPQIAFLLGMALSRTNQGNEAESVLKSALMAIPEDPALNLELGVLYYNKSALDEAGDYFDQAILLAPESIHAIQSRDYLKRIERTTSTSPWDINLTAGLQYDTNVIINGKSSPLPQGYSGKSDWSGLFNVKGNYKLLRTETNEIAASYNFYQSLYNKQEMTDYNISHNLLELSAVEVLSTEFRLKANYAFEYLFLGGEKYDYANIIGPTLLHINDTWGTTSLDYRYRDTRYTNSSRFIDNVERNGANHLITASHILQFDKAGALWASYAFDKDNTNRIYWDYKGNRVTLGGQAILPLSLSAILSGDIYWKKYSGVDPSNFTRDDTQYTISGSISGNLSDMFSLTLSEVFTRNHSNIDAYDYKRSTTTLLLNARF